MNDCEQASRLGAYRDGELSPDCRAEFERHLRRCPQCAGELERIRKLAGLLKSLPGVKMDQPAIKRLHHRIAVEAAHGIGRIAEALTAAAAIILVACIIGLAREGSSQPGQIAMPLWEAQAVAQEPTETTSAATDQVLASWMVQDLSYADEHD